MIKAFIRIKKTIWNFVYSDSKDGRTTNNWLFPNNGFFVGTISLNKFIVLTFLIHCSAFLIA